MHPGSRIPQLHATSFDGALSWFSEMQVDGLMFHPDDDPAEISRIADGKRVFTDEEAAEVRFVLSALFSALGDEVYEAAYPVVMKSAGLRLDA
ncbi:hypothetical protein AZOA_39450 [Azoarcus sp. Aa7]|nr:hypothetical protein [Azoarcus sp. Aa7]